MNSRAQGPANTALPVMAIVGAVLSAWLVAGCGIRGPLEYPNADVEQSTTASAESGQGKPANAAPKPHKGFVLDGLLR